MPSEPPEPAYHLLLEPDEARLATTALRLYITDEAHQARIRELARAVLAALERPTDVNGALTVPLSAEEMKVTYSAIRLLLNDLRREQAPERATLHAILDKLPDEHSIRAITIA